MNNWKWTSKGLYDGEVPIIWAAQTAQTIQGGEVLVGVMADWEDAIAAVPDLLEACKDLLKWHEEGMPTAYGIPMTGGFVKVTAIIEKIEGIIASESENIF